MKSSPTTSTAETVRAGAGAGGVSPGRFMRLVRHPLFPFVPQAAALAVLVLLIAAGWGLHGIEGVDADGPLLYTNLATLGFWVVWLMGLLLLFPAAGRLWCTLCPVGLCNDLAARVGLKAAYPRRLQNFIGMALLLVLASAAARLWSLNRYPDWTALLLLGVLAAALAAGLVFRGRVFCRFWCPVGGLAGLYARLAPVEVAAKDQGVCRRCESKACFLGTTKWFRLAVSSWHTVFPLRRPGCPAYLFPPEGAPGAQCLMCTQCLKNCPHDNLRWGPRRPFAGLFRGEARDRSEALLLVGLTGIVLVSLSRFWPALRDVVDGPGRALAARLLWLPGWAARGLELLSGHVFWPLLFFLLLAALARLASRVSLTPWPGDGEETAGLLYDVAELDDRRRGEERGWRARRHTLWGFLAAFGYACLPLTGGAYAAFALVKLNEKVAWLPLALSDPAGMRSYFAVTRLHLVPPPESLLPLVWVRWVALALVAGGLLATLLVTGRAGASVYGAGSPEARRGALVFRAGALFLGTILIISVKMWLFR